VATAKGCVVYLFVMASSAALESTLIACTTLYAVFSNEHAVSKKRSACMSNMKFLHLSYLPCPVGSCCYYSMTVGSVIANEGIGDLHYQLPSSSSCALPAFHMYMYCVLRGRNNWPSR
jgi:hypothetical protein